MGSKYSPYLVRKLLIVARYATHKKQDLTRDKAGSYSSIQYKSVSSPSKTWRRGGNFRFSAGRIHSCKHTRRHCLRSMMELKPTSTLIGDEENIMLCYLQRRIIAFGFSRVVHLVYIVLDCHRVEFPRSVIVNLVLTLGIRV